MNATPPIKTAIAAAFSAAADTYDANAHMQREVAARLATRISALPLPMRPRILEIGCGTGFLSKAVSPFVRNAEWVLTDVSAAMLEQCRRNFSDTATFLVMDGENPTLPASPGFDLICSSLTFQWFNDLGAGIRRLMTLLKPGGYLVYTTFAADSFKEWRAAHDALGLTPAMPTCPSLQELSAMTPGGHVDEERFMQSYDNGHDFLKQLRRIGAHQPREAHQPLPPGSLRRVLRRLSHPDGIDMTYHVAFGWLQRP